MPGRVAANAESTISVREHESDRSTPRGRSSRRRDRLAGDGKSDPCRVEERTEPECGGLTRLLTAHRKRRSGAARIPRGEDLIASAASRSRVPRSKRSRIARSCRPGPAGNGLRSRQAMPSIPSSPSRPRPSLGLAPTAWVGPDSSAAARPSGSPLNCVRIGRSPLTTLPVLLYQ